jgi:hypothetical protein
MVRNDSARVASAFPVSVAGGRDRPRTENAQADSAARLQAGGCFAPLVCEVIPSSNARNLANRRQDSEPQACAATRRLSLSANRST